MNIQVLSGNQAISSTSAPARPADCTGTPAACPDNEGHGCACSAAAAPQAAARIPKWIDDKKGSDPIVDDLIFYIEKIAAPQVVADERELPPLFEMASAADLAYVMQTPKDWDADYRSAWQKLQVEAHNKRQWRKYALELRAALAAAPVQAQEPVAYTAGSHDIFELIREWAHKPEGERYEAARKIIGYVNATYTAGIRDGKFLGASSATVQPVAMPDVWISELVGGIADDLSYGHGYRQGFNDCRAKVLAMNLAAPATQGDAKELTDDEIVKAVRSVGVDTNPSKFGFGVEQIEGMSVTVLRQVIAAIAAKAVKP